MNGLKAFGGGIGFILTTPGTWLYALVPIVIMLVLTCALGAAGLWGANWATDALVGEVQTIWGHVGSWLLYLVLAAAALVLALLLALVLAQPFSGFALEAITLAQERALTGYDMVRPPFLTVLFASLRASLVTLLVGGGAYSLLFVVGLALPPATVVTVPLQFLVSGWLLAWNFIDYPLGLRGMGVGSRLLWIGRNFGSFSLFGLCWAGVLLVPGLFLLVLPMGVAGAARLVIADELRPRRLRRVLPPLDVLPACEADVRPLYVATEIDG
jgi:CysZ protein